MTKEGWPLGATYLGRGRCVFSLWAPDSEHVEVRIIAPEQRVIPMERGMHGYHHAVVEGMEPGALYLYRLDGGPDRPDPASRSQPNGVFGPS